MEFALSQGWDLTESIDDFVASQESVYKSTMCFTVQQDPEVVVSEYDVYLAGKGEITENMQVLLAEYLKNLQKHKVYPDAVLNVSNHSGGSDYLFARDIYEYFEKEL